MRWFLICLCSYELAALVTHGRCWPTITTLVHHNRDHPLVVVAVGAFTSWVWFHLLVEKATG